MTIETSINQVEAREPFTAEDARELGNLMGRSAIADGRSYLGVGHDLADDALDAAYEQGVDDAFAAADIERD